MNLTSVVGFALAVATVWFTVIAESPNPAGLLEWKGMMLVVGGTVSAGLTIYPFSEILHLGRFTWSAVIMKRVPDRSRLAEEIVAAGCLQPREHGLLSDWPASHPFLDEGLKLIAEGQLSEAELRDALTRRSQYFKQSYMGDAKMLAVLAKFPSSFGMLGSTVGLVDMMSELGKDGQEGIGPAMAMALVATFWGLVFTYMILMPLSDYAQRLAEKDALIRQMIVEGVLAIKRGDRPIVILRKLNGFLPPFGRLGSRNMGDLETFVAHSQEEADYIQRRIKKSA
jgi:chemotaxis protein MotA